MMGLTLVLSSLIALAAAPDQRVLDTAEAVVDARATASRSTNTVFTMPTYTRESWEAKRAEVRRRFLIGCGLWPLPERTPLNTKISDRMEFDGYSIEKVSFEAYPGFLVTGNLYRPLGEGPFPAVINPHGHWEAGRLQNDESCSVPARCITLARMGIVAFAYDMIGYNDSVQFMHRWGSPELALWGIHPFGMQLWSSIRALDFVEGLPGVDKTRLGCTGASGGGTQTFALYSVDDRLAVAAPVNMISSTMQGGCVCENAPLIRLGASNMEIGAMMAPRPLLLISATGDWTRETPRVEFPAIREIYGLYGAEAQVENVHIDAGHNYNAASRAAMYAFFGKHLLGAEGAWRGVEEGTVAVPEAGALRVFPDGKTPEGYPGFQEIIAQMKAERAEAATRALAADTFRAENAHLLGDVLGAAAVAVNSLAPERVGVERRDGHVLERWILRRSGAGDAVPALLYRGVDGNAQEAVVLVQGRAAFAPEWQAGEGKAAFAKSEGPGPGPLVQGLLDAGKMVLCIDAFLIGEHHAPEARTERLREPFLDTFLPSDLGLRVQDVLTAVAYLDARRDTTGTVTVAGFGDGAVWALLAGAMDGRIGRVVYDAAGLPTEDDADYLRRAYVPGLRAVGGLAAARALYAPGQVLVAADANRLLSQLLD